MQRAARTDRRRTDLCATRYSSPAEVPIRRLYLRRHGLALDLQLILLSFWITFRGTWESRGKKF